MPADRNAVFDYIFSKADEVGYMGLDTAASSKFQDALLADSELIKLAGKRLERNYIKDTVLNRYSKLRRYITADDILSVLVGISPEDIEGDKRDLENGVFYINYKGSRIPCTSSSYSEWQTVFKRFGKNSSKLTRFAFLTCGGIAIEKCKTDEVKEILLSYGINSFIVKPNEAPQDIDAYISQGGGSTYLSSAIPISKPFILLAGISGTGKSRFVRKQAEYTCSSYDSYCLVSVRPDWHEPSDLLGYVSRLTGRSEYVVTDTLIFIVKAWKNIFDEGCLFLGGGVSGTRKILEKVSAFWLCLDEMNLAPVEQYFADYLSVLETRHWDWSGDDFAYSCDALFKASSIGSVDNDKLRADLDLLSSEYDVLWEYFRNHGICLPFNLIVAGTVNMDETTNGFSRKVIDRALSFDFGEFYPNTFDSYFSPRLIPKKLTFPTQSRITQDVSSPVCDVGWIKTINFLNDINAVLRQTPFELAYRALNELLLSVASFNPASLEQLQAVWDDFLMCKVLPRIEGDIDKLTKRVNSVNVGILEDLEVVCAGQLKGVWDSDSRPDLHQEYLGGSNSELAIACRSKKKIAWMKDRLERSGFTSFWP